MVAKSRTSAGILLTSIACLVLLIGPSHALDLVVTSHSDNDVGYTLRSALREVLTNHSNVLNTITFSTEDAIVLEQGPLPIIAVPGLKLAIRGSESSPVVIDGASKSNVFIIDEGSEVSFEHLIIRNGHSRGGNGACVVSSGGGGGGAGLGAAILILNGTVTASRCTFANNTAVGGGGGEFNVEVPFGSPCQMAAGGGGGVGGDGGYGDKAADLGHGGGGGGFYQSGANANASQGGSGGNAYGPYGLSNSALALNGSDGGLLGIGGAGGSAAGEEGTGNVGVGGSGGALAGGGGGAGLWDIEIASDGGDGGYGGGGGGGGTGGFTTGAGGRGHGGGGDGGIFGNGKSGDGRGGAILVRHGSLTLTHCAFSGNRVEGGRVSEWSDDPPGAGLGGAIFIDPEFENKVCLADVEFSNNQASTNHSDVSGLYEESTTGCTGGSRSPSRVSDDDNLGIILGAALGAPLAAVVGCCFVLATLGLARFWQKRELGGDSAV